MANTYFTADHHFQHEAMIELAKRPYRDIPEMDVDMIRKWNNKVKKEDTVFHLGDFLLRGKDIGGIAKEEDYKKYLNGTIIQVMGNHDWRNNIKSKITHIKLFYMGLNVLLVHGPIEARGSLGLHKIDLILCGHVHKTFKAAFIHDPIHECLIPTINVGVDVWDFTPVGYKDIQRLYSKMEKTIEELPNLIKSLDKKSDFYHYE